VHKLHGINMKKKNIFFDFDLNSSLEFVYPFGASLNVQPPAVSVLSTGSTCLPCQRTVCAFYTSPTKVS
jgi:hypothetical protein